MDFESKYLKYKFKYVNLKIRGGGVCEDTANSIDKIYTTLNEKLIPYSIEELEKYRWNDRIVSNFLQQCKLYKWKLADDWDIENPYMFTRIYDIYEYKGSLELLIEYKESLFGKGLRKFQEKIKENPKGKHCALYGAPIVFKDGTTEPHAYIIYKDKESDILYSYNGRGNSIMMNDEDLANEHIEYSWGESIKPSPLNCIAIQSKADGLVFNNGTCTKKSPYRGLCFPVVVICAYLFMNSNGTFEDVIGKLNSKEPKELSDIFLKMNNLLGHYKNNL